MSRKKFWKTPPEVMQALNDEFRFTNDMCPYPKPENFDALNRAWGDINFVNPPFRAVDGAGYGPTAFVRKAIEQHKQGKKSVIIIPTKSYVNMLLEAGAVLRPMGRIKWRECQSNKEMPNPSPITMFILK